MYSAFDHWAHWSHMLTVITMCSPCAQWVFGPLSPVTVCSLRIQCEPPAYPGQLQSRIPMADLTAFASNFNRFHLVLPGLSLLWAVRAVSNLSPSPSAGWYYER